MKQQTPLRVRPTIARLIEAVTRIMVRRVHYDVMTTLLQCHRGVDHKAFRATCRIMPLAYNDDHTRTRRSPAYQCPGRDG